MPRPYEYRLTLTFRSGKQWRLGVDTVQIGEDVGRELARDASDLKNLFLSEEKTGKKVWSKGPKDFAH